MKLLIVTIVEHYESDVLQLFKKADIKNFSSSDIEGFKEQSTVAMSSWFPGEKSSTRSVMLFSFAEEENIDKLFELIRRFNEEIDFPNPVKAVVVPIERSL